MGTSTSTHTFLIADLIAVKATMKGVDHKPIYFPDWFHREIDCDNPLWEHKPQRISVTVTALMKN